MAASHCVPYHPHPAAALRHDQFECAREPITDNNYYEEHSSQIDCFNKLDQRNRSSQPPDLLLPPPYNRAHENVDLTTLPPLPETPTQRGLNYYPDDVFGSHYTAGDRRPLQRELDSDSEVFLRKKLYSDSSHSICSQNNSSFTQFNLSHRLSIGETCSKNMGSGGSIIGHQTPEPSYTDKHSKKKYNDIAGFSDKREKSGGGMKKKIRHSLDKLNIRAFPWGSTDKLINATPSNETSKSKKSSSKESIRRYSDSNAPASINSISSVLTRVRGKRDASPAVRPSSSSSYNDMISLRKTEGNSVVSKGWNQNGKLMKTYMGGHNKDVTMKTRKSDFGPWSTVATTFASPMNPHYMNSGNQEKRQEKDTVKKSLQLDKSAVFRPKSHGNEYTDYPSPVLSGRDQTSSLVNETYYPAKERDESNERSLDEKEHLESYFKQDRGHYTIRGRNPNCNQPIGLEFCKPKGTWSLLRCASKTPRRPGMHHINPASYYDSSPRSAETIISVQEGSISSNKIIDSTPAPGLLTKPAHPDSSIIPPPKLTPVSGRLLVNKNSDSSAIVRPTAFKAVVPEMKRISLPSEQNCPIIPTNGNGQSKISPCPEINISSDVYVCQSSPNTDSGRNSASSINPSREKPGSCYSASEGYESARVSSTTAQDQHSDKGSDSGRPISSTAFSSSKNNYHLHEHSSARSALDDVMIQDLESKVRERENDLLQLQRSLQENEKTLSKVYEDRNRDNFDYCDQYSTRAMCPQLQNQNSERISHSEVTSTTSLGEDDPCEEVAESSVESRVEECQWTLQQKCGEISLLKGLLRESQADVNRRLTEIAAERAVNRDLRNQCGMREQETERLLDKLRARDKEIAEMARKLRDCHSRSSSTSSGTPNSISLSSPPQSPSRLQKYSRPRKQPNAEPIEENNNNEHARLVQSHLLLQAEIETLRRKLISAEERLNTQQEKFEREKSKWNEEKTKVIRYQKKLQSGYVEVHKRSQDLEEKLRNLTGELEQARNCLEKEDAAANMELRFPTDI